MSGDGTSGATCKEKGTLMSCNYESATDDEPDCAALLDNDVHKSAPGNCAGTLCGPIVLWFAA